MDPLTSRQQRIIDFIQETVKDRGYPPTVREIGEAVGLTSSSSVHSQLANLERMGYIHRDPTKPRALGLSEEAPHSVAVPLVGSIAAGSPTLATEDIEEVIAVPEGFADDREHFALRIAGESMIGAGIMDGDIVVVRRQSQASEGDIVAALLPGPAEDEATVKRFHRDNGRVMLVPENPALEPFEMTDGRILGKVTAVLRKV
jgi:repressor LexA